MAKFPRYTSTTVARGSGVARASDIGSLTRTSDQAVYSGLGAFGRGLGAASEYAFRVTQERHDIDTKLQHAKATSAYEGFVLQLSKQIDEAPVETNMQRQEMHKSLMRELDKYYQTKLKEVDNKDASDAVKISWQRDRLRYDSALWSTLSRNLDRYEAQNAEDIIKNFIKNGNPEEAQRQAGYYVSKGLFSKEDADNIIQMQTVGTEARNLFYAKGIDEAVNYVMAQDVENKVRDSIISDLASAERMRATRHKQSQEQANNQMLSDFWNGDLTDPQIVTNALEADLITATNAKYLRDAIMNPDPPKHNLKSEAQVLQSIEDIGTNAGTKDDALSVLYANVRTLDPVKGSSLLKAIYAAHDKNIAEIQRESRDVMEELIRDKDKFSGLFTDDERQILAHSEAYLMLDEEIKKAAAEGKPLNRRDTLIRATEIGRQMKKKIKSEESVNKQAEFEPGKPPPKKGIDTMTRPRNMAEFDAAIDALPNEDAKRRYFRKWYKDVPKD